MYHEIRFFDEEGRRIQETQNLYVDSFGDIYEIIIHSLGQCILEIKSSYTWRQVTIR